MRIAILGATSQIAKDLVLSYSKGTEHSLLLYARRADAVRQWLQKNGLGGRHQVLDYAAFATAASTARPLDAILNFVGVGNPAAAAAMGASIFDVTLDYDSLALNYLKAHPDCRYLFLSSGAAYNASFFQPADATTPVDLALNQLGAQNWYGLAKLHAECRHRALPHLPIVDLRVFNYFSHTQDLEARFLITDALRAVRDGTVLQTSADYMVRDYLHPDDFFQTVQCLLAAAPANRAVDCYSQAPVDKPSLLAALRDHFSLRFETVAGPVGVQATGNKPHYYSLNRQLADVGYVPQFDSLGGVLQQAKTLLGR